MSSDIHCTLTATVVSTWAPITPQGGGKEHHEMKVKLDDREWSGKKFAGRNVSVKSYERKDYLPHVEDGDRVFITGTVQSQSYTSTKTGKASAYSVVYAKTVAREWQRSEPQADPDNDPRYPAAANAKMKQPVLPVVAKPIDDEESDVPF